MTTKQLPGSYAPNGAKYGTVTDGAGTLSTISLTASTAKQLPGAKAPDGSIYFCLTDGNNTLK